MSGGLRFPEVVEWIAVKRFMQEFKDEIWKLQYNWILLKHSRHCILKFSYFSFKSRLSPLTKSGYAALTHVELYGL